MTSRHFLLAGPLGPVTAIRSFAATDDERRRALPVATSRAYLRALAGDDSRRHTLAALCSSVGGAAGVAVRGQQSSGELLAPVLDALERGRVLLVPGWTREATVRAAENETPPEKVDWFGNKPAKKEEDTWFEVKVVDDVGKPVSGLQVVFGLSTDDIEVPTNGAGVARVEGAFGSRGSVRLKDVSAVRKALKERWKKPRPATVKAARNVLVWPVTADLPTAGVDGKMPVTISLFPYSTCREIEGSHFDHGRSFVRAEAFDALRAIVQAFEDDAERKGAVFGHTDTSGPEALNKELSERRARAVVALLTHDAEEWESLRNGGDAKEAKEKWGVVEVQHQLVALDCGDDDGTPLVEDGVMGEHTRGAIKRLQRGDFAKKPDDQAPMDASGEVDEATRKALFLAYAAQVSKTPVDESRFTVIGGKPYMGCGERNPLRLRAKDVASRRVVVFVFDPAAEPTDLPCTLGDLGPCNSNSDDAPEEMPADGSPPYRCRIYKELSRDCKCGPGERTMLIEVQLHDELYEPQKTTEYRMKLPSGRVISGVTDDEGHLFQAVPKRVQTLVFAFTPEGRDEEIEVSVYVTPAETGSDADYLAKMRSMGFGDEEDDDATVILKFQGAYPELEPTGELTDETKKAVDDATADGMRSAFDLDA